MTEGEGGRARNGWEAHRIERRRAWLEATPAQRLAWLEEMIELAYRTGALPRRVEPDRAT